MLTKPKQHLPCPKPTKANWNPTASEFEAWCSHPVTEWVAAALESKAQGITQIWANRIFSGDDSDLVAKRIEYGARIDSLRTFLLANHADYLSELDPQAWKGTYGDQ